MWCLKKFKTYGSSFMPLSGMSLPVPAVGLGRGQADKYLCGSNLFESNGMKLIASNFLVRFAGAVRFRLQPGARLGGNLEALEVAQISGHLDRRWLSGCATARLLVQREQLDCGVSPRGRTAPACDISYR